MEKLRLVDADTLLSTPMEKTVFIVESLIPQGVTVLSGSGKIGKSWLMLWLGLRAAQGLPLWDLATCKCDVLYLCLEDTRVRIQERLYTLTDEAPPACGSPMPAAGWAAGWRGRSRRLWRTTRRPGW